MGLTRVRLGSTFCCEKQLRGGGGREKLKKMGVNIGTGMSVASTEETKANISSGGEGKPCPSGLLHKWNWPWIRTGASFLDEEHREKMHQGYAAWSLGWRTEEVWI